MTLEIMKQLALEKHYSQSMIVDIICRDHHDLMIASNMSRKAIRNLLIKFGVKHDNSAYLKLPQEVRLQFKFHESMSLDEIRAVCREKSRKGAATTCKIRRNWDHYTPKNHPSYYVKTTSSYDEAERQALEFRRLKSPYSKQFVKYAVNDGADKCISELARNRGIKGLLSMRAGVSRLETAVSAALTTAGLLHVRQHVVGRYVYDILMPDENLIIEINGTYWHADPRVYNADDVVKFPYGLIKAQEKWEKDATKIKYAIDSGYKVMVLWEIDLKKKGFLDDYVSRFCRN
jgi:G:T-mismatch repair DNA endonuclease (very short patch repair protein)